jgi:lysophospholipase L1-like esterase
MDNKTIEEHYKKYGNTNLITNSGLENNRQVHAIGDSHSIFFHNSMKIYEHWGHIVSMYNLVKQGIDIFKLGNILGNGHEKYNINMNDYVIFYYGYNDIQKHFFINYRNNIENNIELLINSYIEYILHLKNNYKIVPIIPCIYPLPIKKGSLDIMGSDEERINYTQITNKLLETKCKENTILFLNIYDDISNNNKINEKYTVDGIHLDYNNDKLRKHIESKIYELIM